MFTGLIEESAIVSRIEALGNQALRLTVCSRLLGTKKPQIGDSIALNGACMTLTQCEGDQYSFEVSAESLNRTNSKNLVLGAPVHLETSLRYGGVVGGHLVSGHVDALGLVESVETVDTFRKIVFKVSGDAQARIAPFLVEKGSIAVDGVSLTVNGVVDQNKATYFDVCLIPHTLEKTHFGHLTKGSEVNLEADLTAKYLNRYKDFFYDKQP